MSTIIILGGDCKEIIIEILIMDRSSATSGAGSRMRRRRSEVPSCYDLQRRLVRSRKQLNK